ncbi:MAG: YqhA family protein [Bacteroidales bacterium]|nr:YqhA family protein [Bacteroidales bacterium]
MSDLLELRKTFFKDGNFGDVEVKRLQEFLYDEEGMTREKGDFLFELKDVISPEKQSVSFKRLFVKAICELLLEDEDSPGEIDDAEAKWLRGRMQKKGFLDKTDRKLLSSLRQKAINFPPMLNYKTKGVRIFEGSLYATRFLTILSVIGSLLAAVALFIKGSLLVGDGVVKFFAELRAHTWEHGFTHSEELIVIFVSSVDMYLFAMVLIIFGVGIYELFISRMDPVERQVDSRPSWLQISSIDDLKAALGKVILMILIVSFFRHTLTISYNSPLSLLYLSIGIILIAAALYLAHSHKGEKTKSDKTKK